MIDEKEKDKQVKRGNGFISINIREVGDEQERFHAH